MAINPLDKVMEQIANFTPDDDDASGITLKNAFTYSVAADAIKDMRAQKNAETNMAMALEAGITSSSVDTSNQMALNTQQSQLGSIQRGEEYDYQSQFAADQANRQLNQTAMEGTINENLAQIQAKSDRHAATASADAAKASARAQAEATKESARIQAQNALKQTIANNTTQLQMTTDQLKNNLDSIDRQTSGNIALQGVKDDGEFERLQEANKAASTQIEQQGDIKKDLQDTVGDQQLAQLTTQTASDQAIQELKGEQSYQELVTGGAIQTQMQDIKGEQALEQLDKSGLNEQELQRIRDSGALRQIGAQGNEAVRQITEKGEIDKTMLGTKGEQALAQITGQGDEAVRQITTKGEIDERMLGTKGKQALEQITGQGDQAVRQITAKGEIDERMLGTKGTQEMDQLKAQGFLDERMQELKGQQAIGQIQETSSQGRKTERDREQSQSKYARSLAGMF